MTKANAVLRGKAGYRIVPLVLECSFWLEQECLHQKGEKPQYLKVNVAASPYEGLRIICIFYFHFYCFSIFCKGQ